MWESCKDSVWESVKKNSRVCTQQDLVTGSHDWLAVGKSSKEAHVWSMQRSWRVTPIGALQDKTSSLARQLARDLNSRLSQVARSSRQTILFGKTDISHSKHTPVSIPLIPTYCKELPGRILREKLLKKNKIDSSTIFIFWFSKFLYSHPLHCYIIERYINQIIFSPYPYLWEGYLVLGKQLRRDQLILVDTMSYSGIR